MLGPKKPRVRFDTTVANPALTATLASRVRRDVALEKATLEVSEANEDSALIPIDVVLEPDGTPLVVDEADVRRRDAADQKAPQVSRPVVPRPVPRPTPRPTRR